ncbi:hypothetical protein D3C84_1102300 [compost metagenome]
MRLTPVRSAPPSAMRLTPVRSAPSSAMRLTPVRSAPPSAMRLTPVRSAPSAARVLLAFTPPDRGSGALCGRAKALRDKLVRIRLARICFFIFRLLVGAVSGYGAHITDEK